MNTANGNNTNARREMLGLFALPFLLVALLITTNAWKQRQPNKIESHVAYYPDTDTRERAAIRSISNEVKRRPRAKIYVVRMPGNKVYADGLLTYDRQKQKLVRRCIQPMGNGQTSWWNGVRDISLHKAASKAATFNDMADFGCRPMS